MLFALCLFVIHWYRATSLVMHPWGYFDFSDSADSTHMYGVLDCCMYSNITSSSNKLLGSYYDYLFPPATSYSDTSHDLALHMGMAHCVTPPDEPDNIAATTVRKSTCLIPSPDRRLMIVDAAFRYAQYETHVLKSVSVSTVVPLNQCRVTRMTRTIPMGIFYVAWSAYRYDINSTKYCVTYSKTITAEYGATIDRATMVGTRLTCDDVADRRGSCVTIGPDKPHYNVSIVWPNGYAETPSFRGIEFVCKDVPSQSIYTAIHMYPPISLLAMKNMALTADLSTLANGATCGQPSDPREWGLCLLHKLYSRHHPILDHDFGRLSPYFGCLKSFVTGKPDYTYPKCIGDLNNIRTSFGTYDLTIVPEVKKTTFGGFYTRSVQTVNTGCVIPPVSDSNLLRTVMENVLLCKKVLVVVTNATDVDDAIAMLKALTGVCTNLGVQIPGSATSTLPSLMSRVFAEVSKTSLRHVTIDLESSGKDCVLDLLEEFDSKTALKPFKKRFATVKIALKISGRHLACVPKMFETDRSISAAEVDGLLTYVETVIVAVATSRVQIPFTGTPPAPQCPSLWKSRTRSKWLWSPDSNVGPYVTEPILAAGMSHATLGVVIVPNAMAFFGPNRLAVELDTGCLDVRGSLYANNVVTKRERRLHHSTFDQCAPEFGTDCCGIKVDNGYVFVQPLASLQDYVSELMTWGVRHVEFGDMRDVILTEGTITILEILNGMLIPQHLTYMYTLKTETNTNAVYCPGVIGATDTFFFQMSNVPYTGFYVTTEGYPNVGLTVNDHLCRTQASAHMPVDRVNVPPDPQSVRGAYYLDTLEGVDLNNCRDVHFVYVTTNGSLFMYVPTVVLPRVYGIGDYGGKLPAAHIEPEFLDMTGVTTNKDIVYINGQQKSFVNNLGNATVTFRYRLYRVTMRLNCDVASVCDTQKNNQYVDFMAMRNASFALHIYLGNRMPPVTYADGVLNGTMVIKGKVANGKMVIEPYTEFDVVRLKNDVPDITAYVLRRLASVLTGKQIIRLYYDAGNTLACMFGSTIGCWAFIGSRDVMVTGHLVGLTNDRNVTVSVLSVSEAEWVLSYKQVLPLSTIKSNQSCFTTKQIQLMVYPRSNSPSYPDPWGDVGQASWYLCDQCVDFVCLKNNTWEIHTDYGTLTAHTVPHSDNSVPTLFLMHIYIYMSHILATDWNAIALAAIRGLQHQYNTLTSFDVDSIRIHIDDVYVNISTQFINDYKRVDSILLANVSSCFISAVAIVFVVGLCIINIHCCC